MDDSTTGEVDIALVDDRADNLDAARTASQTFSDYTFTYHRGVIGAALSIEEHNTDGVATDLRFGHPIGAEVSPDEYSVNQVEQSPAVNAVFDNWLRRMPESYGDARTERAQAYLDNEAFTAPEEGILEQYKVLSHILPTLQDTSEEAPFKEHVQRNKDALVQRLNEINPVAAIMGTRSIDRHIEAEFASGTVELPHGVALSLYAADEGKAYHIATSMHRHRQQGSPISSMTYCKPMIDQGYLTTEELYNKGAGSNRFTETQDKSNPEEWEAVIDKVVQQLRSS